MYFVSREKNEVVLKLLAIKKRMDHSVFSPVDPGLTSLDLMDWTVV